MEGAPRLSYGTTKVHNLYPIFRPLPLPWASITLLYPAKGIRADTPLARYRYAAISDTLIRGRSARGPCADVEGAIPRAVPSLGGYINPWHLLLTTPHDPPVFSRTTFNSFRHTTNSSRQGHYGRYGGHGRHPS